ncbi:cell division protein ZapA [Paludibacter sp. 221]|uniref:cell division protein ZapA n=1 Tax=Paludibacter sp. 221 TaxID=2302939 RepID=UPI0013D29178|nr:cell division protein ZapA [Paludibacter sp. 221]NDV45797.1 cell division protein ZapA [Paludibacter sp. 221]
MKDDNFIINVNIGGFRFPLNIARKDEEIYRNAEKKANKVLTDNQKKYHQRSAEEILSITAFQIAVALSKAEIAKDLAPVIEKLNELDEEVLKALSD